MTIIDTPIPVDPLEPIDGRRIVHQGACCFDDGNCSTLTRKECLAGFGFPFADGTFCVGDRGTNPGIYQVDCAVEACCYDASPGQDPPVPKLCLNLSPRDCLDPFFGSDGQPQGRGTFCGGGGTRPEEDFAFPCDRNIDDFRKCCFDDGSSNPPIGSDINDRVLTEEECIFIGGHMHDFNEPCEDLGPGDGCRKIQADRVPPGGFGWTLDVCANTAMEPVIRPPAQEDSLPVTTKNYFELHTMRRARAMKEGGQQVTCKHYYSQMALAEDGYAMPLFCSTNATIGIQLHPGTAMLARDDDITQKGYGIILAAYHTPLWTEVAFDGPVIRCTEIPV